MPIQCICISGHQHQLDLPSSCSGIELYSLVGQNLSLPSSKFYIVSSLPLKPAQKATTTSDFHSFQQMTREAYAEESAYTTFPTFIPPSNDVVTPSTLYVFCQLPSPSFTSSPLPIRPSQQFSLPLSLSVSTGPKQTLLSLLSTLSKILTHCSLLHEFNSTLTSSPVPSYARRTITSVSAFFKVLRVESGAVSAHVSTLIPQFKSLKGDFLEFYNQAATEYLVLCESTVPTQLRGKYECALLSELVISPEVCLGLFNEKFDKYLSIVKLILSKSKQITSKLRQFTTYFDSWLGSLIYIASFKSIPHIHCFESVNALHWVGSECSEANDVDGQILAEYGSKFKTCVDFLTRDDVSWSHVASYLDEFKSSNTISTLIHLVTSTYHRAQLLTEAINQSNLIEVSHLPGLGKLPLHVRNHYAKADSITNIDQLEVFISQGEEVLYDLFRFVYDCLESINDDVTGRSIPNWIGFVSDLSFLVSDCKKGSQQASCGISELTSLLAKLKSVINLRKVLAAEVKEIERRRKADLELKLEEERVKNAINQKMIEEQIAREAFDSELKQKVKDFAP
ncbi:hypothetical protein P9112_005428 [Eukaryota sp. TZLM1-RC]